MNSIVIGFAGPVGSGKSTLSKLVSNTLGWPLASFGVYVRKTAEAFGFEKSREGLQLAGNFLINRGWKLFCEEVLSDANWKTGSNLVVEGIRHIEAIATISDIVSSDNFFLIYVSLNEAERKDRLKARDNDSRLNVEELELHSTERQVKTILFDRADLVVDNSRPIAKTAKEIFAWIQELQINK